MAQEFEGDLAGAEFWGADLSGATFRDVNLTGARISHAWVVDVRIDALVENLVVNGVDVTAYVNERDEWYPLRTMIRPSTAAEMVAALDALEREWAITAGMLAQLPDAAAYESVNGEWSYVQTLRHLVFAIDKWFTVPVIDGEFWPLGMPNSGSVDFPWPGLTQGVDAMLGDVLAVRADRLMRFREFVSAYAEADGSRPIDVLENGEHELRDCLHTVYEEEFWHCRYARRDLSALLAGGGKGGAR